MTILCYNDLSGSKITGDRQISPFRVHNVVSPKSLSNHRQDIGQIFRVFLAVHGIGVRRIDDFILGAIAILGWFWYQNRSLLGPKRPILFFLVWILGAFAPISLVVSERITFLTSIGISTLFAILLVGLKQTSRHWSVHRQGIVIAVTALSLNLFVLESQCMRLKKAAGANQTVIAQLAQEINSLPADAEILVANLPDLIEYTLVFGNTFPVAGQVLGYKTPSGRFTIGNWRI